MANKYNTKLCRVTVSNLSTFRQDLDIINELTGLPQNKIIRQAVEFYAKQLGVWSDDV